jgi:hypothetical protein
MLFELIFFSEINFFLIENKAFFIIIIINLIIETL